MKLKHLLTDVFNNGRPSKPRADGLNAPKRAKVVRAARRFVDLETMAPSPRPTQEEVLTKVRNGRFAEMSFRQAGME